MTASFYYRAYGARIESSIPLPGLAGTAPGLADLHIWGRPPEAELEKILGLPRVFWRSGATKDRFGQAHLKIWRLKGDSSYYYFLYSTGEQALVDAAGKNIYALSAPTESVEHTALYLLGPVLMFALRLWGLISLHGSAVSLGGYSAALLGPAGAGKSTAAAALAQFGCAILTDDHVVLRQRGGCFEVLPGYPRLRLRADVVNNLYGTLAKFPQLTPHSDKHVVEPDAHSATYSQDPVPLGVIYVLTARTSEPNAPRIEPLSRPSALLECVMNTFTRSLSDGEMQAADLDVLRELVLRIPVRRVVAHENPERLPDLAQLIIADWASQQHAIQATAILPGRG